MFKNFRRTWLLSIAIVVGVGIYFVPPVHERVGHRVDDLRAQIKYYLNPPEQAVFLPTQQAAIEAIVNATMEAHTRAQDTFCHAPESFYGCSGNQGGAHLYARASAVRGEPARREICGPV